MTLLTRIFLWTGATGLLLLALVEGVMWIFFPAPPRLSQTFEFENRIPGLKEKSTFTVDERYVRTWNPEGGPAGPEVHIVCLGGSATAAILQNAGDAWWGRLADSLQKDLPAASIKVSALALEQRGVLFGARWAQQHFPEIRPDVVVAMYGFDDILLHPGTYTYDPARIDSIALDGQATSGLKKFLLRSSQICRRISRARQRASLAEKTRSLREKDFYLKYLRQSQALVPNVPLKYEIKREAGHDPLAEYLDGLKALSEASAKVGAAFCVLGEPSLNSGLLGNVEERMVHRLWIADPGQAAKGRVRVEAGGIELELNRYQRAAEKFCRENGIPFLNLHLALKPTRDHFVEDVILTDVGAAGAARLVHPVVKPLVEARVARGR